MTARTTLYCAALITGLFSSVGKADEQSVRHILDRMETAWNDNDAKAVAAIFASDCHYALAYGPLVHGRDGVRAVLAPLFEGSLRESIARLHVNSMRETGKQVILVDGRWSLENASDSAPKTGDFVMVCEKQADRWWPVYWRATSGGDRSPTTFARQIEAFREQDQRIDIGSEPLVLFAGDSLIRFWDVEKNFPEWNTLNRGFGGAQISDVIFYADDVLRHRPAVLVYNCGGNNLNMGKSLDETLREQAYFWEMLFKRWPDAKVLVIPKTVRDRGNGVIAAEAMNQDLRRAASEDERIEMVDEVLAAVHGPDGRRRSELLLPDGHFNERGYEVLSSVIRPRLQELLPRSPRTDRQ